MYGTSTGKTYTCRCMVLVQVRRIPVDVWY